MTKPASAPSSTRLDVAIVALCLALGSCFWLQRLGINDHDDAVSNEVMFARQPLPTLLLRVPWADQSPAYFLVLHAWRVFGESPRAVASLNLIMLSVIVLLLYRRARELYGSRRVAFGAALLAALSPASLWIVRNGRMYSIQILLTLLAIGFLRQHLRSRSPRPLVGFVAVAVLSIYTHLLGVLITAALIAWLAVAGREDRGEGGHGPGRLAAIPLRLLLAVSVLAFPQLVRLGLLVASGPPLRRGWSIPGLSLDFLGRVSGFVFVNADWGVLRPYSRSLTAACLASAYGLLVAGLAAAPRRTRLLIALVVLVPLALLGLAAWRMDVRERYFSYALPLVWITIAGGALGRPGEPSAFLGRAVGALRVAAFLVLLAASSWLLYDKLAERYPQWTKLMTGLNHLYRPGMVLYVAPGPPAGTPKIVAEELGLPPAMRQLHDLVPATRASFLREADAGQEFMFLVHWADTGEELRWRGEHLLGQGYRKTVLPVWGAYAQVFTRGEPEGFSDRSPLSDEPAQRDVLAWARHRRRERSPGEPRAFALEGALVARVDTDGSAREARLFMSQRGEDPEWRLGPAEADAVRRTSAAGGANGGLLAHLGPGSTLLVAFPDVPLEKTLELTCGRPDPAGEGDIALAVYVGREKSGEALCPRAPGWTRAVFDTSSAGRRADVTVLARLESGRGTAFAFDVGTPGRAWPLRRGPVTIPSPGPVALRAPATLRDFVGRLRVSRVSTDGSDTIHARFQTRALSAADVHEPPGAGGEGSLGERWVLGALPWDAVGVARVRAGGQVRDALWAHPRDGTTLVIEADLSAAGPALDGFLGVTDFAVGQAAARLVTDPVRFRLTVDDATVLETSARREAGWKSFTAPLPPSRGGLRRLRIEVDSARDSWAHFAFDLGRR